MECQYCAQTCRKAGKQKNGAQKLFCINCKKYQQTEYKYQACKPSVVSMIPKLLCESVGIRGIARILNIATTTVITKIISIAAAIPKPAIPCNRRVFEMDELRTYVGRKGNEYWVAYALCADTKQVIDFTVGKRSKRGASFRS